jgi:hypothetical protein
MNYFWERRPSGSILFADTAVTDRDQLHERLVVVAHRDLGFKVARLQRLASSDLLVSSNPKYLPLDGEQRYVMEGLR